MTKHEIRLSPLGNGLNHLMRADPVVVVARQPALGDGLVVVLMDVVLVCGEDPGSAVGEVDLYTVFSLS